MMIDSRHISAIAALVMALPLYLGAQTSLPSFPRDPRIVQGVLPDGVSYYLVTNDISKGYADFALVRKNYDDVSGTRDAISSVEGIQGLRPFQFLSDKGIGYQKEGYAAYRDGSTVLNFRNVPAFDAPAADSTLLLIFDMIKTADCPQAVIISGDIDAGKLADRMYMLSMTVPRLPAEEAEAPYQWSPVWGLQCEVLPCEEGTVATISLCITGPRVPRESMNTPQPFVTQMFVRELETILYRRIRRSFRDAGIPIGRISLVHRDSATKAGDENYIIDISTDRSYIDEAVAVLASVLGGIDSDGVTEDEHRMARDQLVANASGADLRETNADYVDKCVGNYLYGASLASLSDICDFMIKRRLSSEKELQFFNGFSKALINPDRSISLTLSGCAGPAERMASIFSNAWKEGDSRDYSFADTLSLAALKSKTRLKLKSSVPDPITGGQTWTFSNGMKVIFKQADTKGRFEYGLMVKGGLPNVPGIKPGEAPFVSDMLGCFNVAGINADEFVDLMRVNGITMDVSVGLSDMRILGSAPTTRLQYLLKSLLSLSTDRSYDAARFDYYRKCQAVSIAEAGIDTDAVLQEMASPDYDFLPVRDLDGLDSGLPVRVGQYFNSQFSRINDGVFVIVGDFDEDELQKTLLRTLGNFECGKGSQIRSRIRKDLRQGWYTRSYEGDPCVAVSLNSGSPFSMNGYMTFKVASVAIRKEVVKALASEGMYAEFEEKVEFYPVDSYSLIVRCRPCSMDGLPSDIAEQKMYRALDAVRFAVNRLSVCDLTEAEVNAYKVALKQVMTSFYANPRALIDAAMTRSSAGRDVVSMWSGYIDGVSVSAVREVLKALDEGARMELVVR